MSHASVSRVRCPFALGSARTDGCISVVLSLFIADNSVSSSEGNSVGWSFRSRFFCGATILAKFWYESSKYVI